MLALSDVVYKRFFGWRESLMLRFSKTADNSLNATPVSMFALMLERAWSAVVVAGRVVSMFAVTATQ